MSAKLVYNAMTSSFQYVIDTGSGVSIQPVLTVNNIAQRNALANPGSRLVHVLDATGDPTVNHGWAIYTKSSSVWVKISEEESIDVDTSVKYADIIGKPNTSAYDIDLTVSKKHEHTNLSVLDRIDVDANNTMTYGGQTFLFASSPNSTALSGMLDMEGYDNLCGGFQLKVVAYDAATKKLSLKSARDGVSIPASSIKAGDKIYVYCNKSDMDIYHECTIASVVVTDQYAASGDETEPTINAIDVILTEAITWSDANSGTVIYAPGSDYEDPSFAVIKEDNRTFTASVTGEWNWSVGLNCSTSGNSNINVGDHSTVTGMCNVVSGFNCMVGGAGNVVTGSKSVVYGVSNSVLGMGCFVIGGTNKALFTEYSEGAPTFADDSILVGRGNESYAMGGAGFGFSNRVYARGGVAVGATNTIEKSAFSSFVIGRGLTTSAPESIMIGQNGELPEYEGTINYSSYATGDKSGIHYRGAFVIAGGVLPSIETNDKNNVIVYTKYKWNKNPAYPWGTSAAAKAQQESTIEDPYLLEEHQRLRINANVEIAGKLTLVNKFLVVNQDTPELDITKGDAWKYTAPLTSAPFTCSLKNWTDGCKGELIVYNGGTRFSIPSTWNKIGTIPGLQTSGYDVFEIRQIDTDVFIRHMFSKAK